MKTYRRCADGRCTLSVSGHYCLACGRIRADSQSVAVPHTSIGASTLSNPDPDDPNYWTHLRHDLEIIDPEHSFAPSGIIGFYARVNRR
jgi:hypothetical protein